MEKMNVVLATKTKEIADYKTYIEIVNRVCYYDEPNGNGVLLPYDDSALDIAQTLVGMPVQAKYIVNDKGEPDLSDHCVSVDDDGNVTFGTESIGVHTEVWIEDDTVQTFKGEIKTLPCLFARQKIWKRYPNYISAITKLYDEGNLHNSWEVSSFEYLYENGTKKLMSYVFEGNAYLGSNVTPAYGESAKALEMSNLMVASALAQDVSALDTNNSRKEDIPMTEKTKENIEVETEVTDISETENQKANTEVVETTTDTTEAKEKVEDTAEEKVEETSENKTNKEKAEEVFNENVENETASLTADDIARKVVELYEEQQPNEYFYCYAHLSAEKTIWLKRWGSDDLSIVVVKYDVSDDDEVSIVGEPVKTTLKVDISTIYKEYSEVVDKLNEAETTISELSQYKDKYETMQSEIEKAELEETKKYLQDMVDNADCLSEEEKHSEEVSSLIENCDEEGLTKYIGNKYIQSSVKRTKKENKKEISNVQHSFKKSLFNDTEISTQEEEAHSKAEDFRSFVFN